MKKTDSDEKEEALSNCLVVAFLSFFSPGI
jgi:hypothetical protein